MRKWFQIAAICVIAAFPFKAVAQTKVLSVQKTTKSNVEMSITNTGIFGLDPLSMVGTNYWPRGSKNQYVFGGGIWFGAKKWISDKGVFSQVSAISYDFDTGSSWMIPGRIEDGLKIDISKNQKYYLQASSQYNPNGTPLDSNNNLWPMWKDNNISSGFKFGNYISSLDHRSSIVYFKGPAFISDEDIIGTFKDTDTTYYTPIPIGVKRSYQNYPIGIQYEQALYSWAAGTPLEDVIAIRYMLVNTSPDTLYNCWFGSALDPDITTEGNFKGAGNDNAYYNTLRNLALLWSEEDNGDEGKGLGYLGVWFIELPSMDSNGFIYNKFTEFNHPSKSNRIAFNAWNKADSPETPEARYSAMSNRDASAAYPPQDQRVVLSTGPFSMKPMDTTYFTVGMVFGQSSGNPLDMASAFKEISSKRISVRDKLFLEPLSIHNELLYSINQSAFITLKNDAATLHFKSDSFKNIRAELFNTLGERMMTINDGEIAASEVSFKTSELPAGMYYCVITSNGERITLPMTIVR